MIYHFDLDNTLCQTQDENYPMSKPFIDRITFVNGLYDEGHKIVVVTARGWVSGINWLPMTGKQLEAWGLKYHDLRAKPYFDAFVDDKAFNSNEFFK